MPSVDDETADFFYHLVRALLAGATLTVYPKIPPGRVMIYNPERFRQSGEYPPGALMEVKPAIMFHDAELRDKFVDKMSKYSELFKWLVSRAERIG